MLYVREDIPSSLIAFEDKSFESVFIELKLKNTKILIKCPNSPHTSDVKNSLDLHFPKYKRILILGNFNVEIEEPNMKSICKNCNLKSLIKQPTCYRNYNKRSCIDLAFTHLFIFLTFI